MRLLHTLVLLALPHLCLALYCYPPDVRAPWPPSCGSLIDKIRRNVTEEGVLVQDIIFYDGNSRDLPTGQPKEALPLLFNQIQGCYLVVDVCESFSKAAILQAAEYVNKNCVHGKMEAGKEYVGIPPRIKVKLVMASLHPDVVRSMNSMLICPRYRNCQIRLSTSIPISLIWKSPKNTALVGDLQRVTIWRMLQYLCKDVLSIGRDSPYTLPKLR